MYLETYVEELMRGKRAGFLAKILQFILYLLSIPYAIGVYLRNWAYDLGWFKSYTPPVPLVISVGNIVAGGTGKTPVTLLLAKLFSEQRPTAILSRGYRSQAEKLSTPVMMHKAQGLMHSATYAGDEPVLLAENAPKALVYVGKDRVLSSNLAMKAGAEVIILDDGMQHRRLARDLEVVVIDADRPFGMGYFLPRGYLRDQISSLSRADFVIFNHVQSKEEYLNLCSLIAPVTKAPCIGCRVRFGGLFDLQNQPYELPKGLKAGLFCGIGNPEKFSNLIQEMAIEVVAQKFFPDHINFDSEEILSFASRSQALGAQVLVCTEKDKVKLLDLPGLNLPVIWLKMELEIVYGASYWDEFIEKGMNLLSHR